MPLLSSAKEAFLFIISMKTSLLGSREFHTAVLMNHFFGSLLSAHNRRSSGFDVAVLVAKAWRKRVDYSLSRKTRPQITLLHNKSNSTEYAMGA